MGLGRIATGTLRGPDRLIRIRDEVIGVCSAATSDLVVLENYSYASTNQAHQIGELGGVLRVALHESQMPYVVVAPMNRAKFATGKGNAKKDEVVSAVSARTGIEFKTNDECDAYVLWQMGLCAYGLVDYVTLMPRNVKEREALTSVDWPAIDCGMNTLFAPVVEHVPPKKKASRT